MFHVNDPHGVRQVGPYELLEVIGEGGMANVYLGIKKSISNIRSFYAVKVIKPLHSQNERFVNMFIDEAKVLATIQHPNLVILHDIVEQSNNYAIVMEYLQGVDCRQILKHHKRKKQGIDVEVATNIIAQACAGLHHAHQATTFDGTPLNLVHRDISPHNMMVTFNGYVKVLDFGIAKSEMGTEETKTGLLKGKLHYFSPEQCNPDLKIDHRTDVFALGIVFYELLTGERPFKGQNELQVIQSIMFSEVASPKTLRPEIPDAIANIALKALAHEPDQRFQSCDAFRSALITAGKSLHYDMSERAMARFMEAEHAQMRSHVESRLKDHIHAADISDQELLITLDNTQEKTLTLGPDCMAWFSRHDSFSGFVLRGEIRESMNIEPIIEHAQGTTVLHLEHISRLTSFGIRHWLTHLPQIIANSDEVYMTHVSMPIVNQLIMIPAMAKDIKILSVMAPFVCTSCDHNFTHKVLAKDYQSQTLTHTPHCPNCQHSHPVFDEDESYLSLLNPTIKASSKLISFIDSLSEKQSTPTPPVEKHISAKGTEIFIHQNSEQIRWDRLLAGADGHLLIQFDPTLNTNTPCLNSLSDALTHVEPSCSIRIEHIPLENADAITTWNTQLRGIHSAQILSTCPHCSAQERRLWLFEDNTPYTTCNSCKQKFTAPSYAAHEQKSHPVEASKHSSSLPLHTLIYAGSVVALILAIIAVIIW